MGHPLARAWVSGCARAQFLIRRCVSRFLIFEGLPRMLPAASRLLHRRAMVKKTALLLLLTLALPLAASELNADAERMNRWFAAASAEFDVPLEVLQSIAYVESRWKHLESSRREIESTSRRDREALLDD